MQRDMNQAHEARMDRIQRQLDDASVERKELRDRVLKIEASQGKVSWSTLLTSAALLLSVLWQVWQIYHSLQRP